MNGARKVHIKSFGCQMNVYDSHRMADMLAPEGFAETSSVEDADLVILNTCHIREKAADKVYSELGRIRVLKQAAARQGRRVVVAVAGCVAQAEGEEIIRRAPAVDLVVGPQSYHRLPDLLARVAWYGGMSMAPHLIGVARCGAIDVTLVWGEPVAFDETSDRKMIARALETAVRRQASSALRGRPAAPAQAT